MTRVATMIGACALLVSAACSKSPTAPSSGSGGQSGAGAYTVFGQTVTATDGTPIPGAAVKMGSMPAAVSDGGGGFRVEGVAGGRHVTIVTGPNVIERRTSVTIAGSDSLSLALIPSSYDLAAFDQMFRATGKLQRWTSAPALVLLATVMNFSSASTDVFYATDERLSEGDLAGLTEDLVWGLSQLTGGRFADFSSIARETPTEGSRVTVARAGTIVVGRYRGLQNLGSTIGWGRWASRDDGSISGGVVFLDRDFDETSGRARRSLRVHELGHALGYLHVTGRPSVMNPAVGLDPTEFDREAARVAFQRPPGNRSPDIDPEGSSAVLFTGGALRWGPLLP